MHMFPLHTEPRISFVHVHVHHTHWPIFTFTHPVAIQLPLPLTNFLGSNDLHNLLLHPTPYSQFDSEHLLTRPCYLLVCAYMYFHMCTWLSLTVFLSGIERLQTCVWAHSGDGQTVGLNTKAATDVRRKGEKATERDGERSKGGWTHTGQITASCGC